MQITPLRFRGDWILHPEVSESGYYPLKFGDVWILHPDILEFRFSSYILEVFEFYSSKFLGVRILPPKLGVFGYYPLDFTRLWGNARNI